MSFVIIKDATFVRADTSPSPTPGSVGDGWVDVTGSIWEINSNLAKAPTNSDLGTGFLLRPTEENFGDGKVRVYPGGTQSGARALFTILRYQDADNFLAAFTFGVGVTPQMTIEKYVAGVSTQIESETDMVFPAANAWYTEFQVIGDQLTYTLFASADDSVIRTFTVTDGDILSEGQWGLGSYFNCPTQEVIGYQVPGAFAPGRITKVSDSLTSVQLLATDASGGIPPYSYQWYRSSVSGFTPGPSTILSGKTSKPLNDTGLVSGAAYYYMIVYTDSNSPTPQVTHSAQFNVVIPNVPPTIIGFIGDSITYGVAGHTTMPPEPTTMVNFLNQRLQVTTLYSAVNQGADGTNSHDWLDSGMLLPAAITAFTDASVTDVCIMLGTNDSRIDTQTSQVDYTANLQNIIDALVGAGFTKIVLNGPPYVASTMVGWEPPISDALILEYIVACQNLAVSNPSTVRMGDSLAYAWFQLHQDQLGNDGIHPDDIGSASLAYLWQQAFAPSGPAPTPVAEGDVIYVPNFSESNVQVF